MPTPENAGKRFNTAKDEPDDGGNRNERIIGSGNRLTIETIDAFAQQMRSALNEVDTVIVDFQEDVELDITALQVFCSACQTAIATGKRIVHRGRLPESLRQLAVTAGSERRDFCKNDNPSCFRKLGGSE